MLNAEVETGGQKARPIVREEWQEPPDMGDRSGKSATSATSLIVNDLAGNTKSYKPATCCSFAGFISRFGDCRSRVVVLSRHTVTTVVSQVFTKVRPVTKPVTNRHQPVTLQDHWPFMI
jgi:hypothetical protein